MIKPCAVRLVADRRDNHHFYVCASYLTTFCYNVTNRFSMLKTLSFENNSHQRRSHRRKWE